MAAVSANLAEAEELFLGTFVRGIFESWFSTPA